VDNGNPSQVKGGDREQVAWTSKQVFCVCAYYFSYSCSYSIFLILASIAPYCLYILFFLHYLHCSYLSFFLI